jgi:SAM-dependent methyltransferase
LDSISENHEIKERKGNMNEEEIRRYLAVIRRACTLIEDQLNKSDADKDTLPEVPNTNFQNVAADTKLARKIHVERLLAIEEWPEAVPPYLVASDASDQDQIDRANAVLDTMGIQGERFLDFGCGEGWITKQMLARGAIEADGYDIKISSTWKKLKGPNFTHNFDDIKKDYYDVVLLYDVLDHAEDPEDVMKNVKLALKKDGKVYIRCHPWTSIHANHIYKKGLNKAYIHLFLMWEEMHDLIGEAPMYTRIEKDPLTAYHWWFRDFTVNKERVVREPVHDFFLQSSFKDLLQKEQRLRDKELEPFMERMSMQFVDYLLIRK